MVTAIFPDVALTGTVVPINVLVALATVACVVLKVTLLLARVSKFVPVMDTAVPGVPMFGVKLEMEGTPEFAETVKFELLETEPALVLTLIGPVVAPVGTFTTRLVADAGNNAGRSAVELHRVLRRDWAERRAADDDCGPNRAALRRTK